MARNKTVIVPITLKLKLSGDMHPMRGKTTNGYEFDHVFVRRTGKTRAYMVAVKNGMRMEEVIKQMKFEKGEVVVKFGSKKLVIGTYTEVRD